MGHSRFKYLTMQFLRNYWWNYYFFNHCTNSLLYIFVETCHFAKWILMAQHLYFVECSKMAFRYHLNSNLKLSIWTQITYVNYDIPTRTMSTYLSQATVFGGWWVQEMTYWVLLIRRNLSNLYQPVLQIGNTDLVTYNC